MYLDRSKERFQQLLERAEKPLWFQPCTPSEIDELTKFLTLPLSKAYEELLLWVGHGCEVFESYRGHFSSSDGINLQDLALEMMQESEFSDTLPEDAIVLWIFDQDFSFAFIRASEGDNPPVHFFSEIESDQNGQFRSHPHFEWNFSPNLDEFCLPWIDNYIANFTSIT